MNLDLLTNVGWVSADLIVGAPGVGSRVQSWSSHLQPDKLQPDEADVQAGLLEGEGAGGKFRGIRKQVKDI